jgi:hypothetical protein
VYTPARTGMSDAAIFCASHATLRIRHSSFVIRHSSFVIRHSSFVIRHYFAAYFCGIFFCG